MHENDEVYMMTDVLQSLQGDSSPAADKLRAKIYNILSQLVDGIEVREV